MLKKIRIIYETSRRTNANTSSMSEQKDPLILENEFYTKEFFFSYSSINMLLYSPSLFYRSYILNQKEEKLDSYLVEGKVIHALLLDNGNFEKNFIVSPTKLPSENTQKVINQVYYKNKIQAIMPTKLAQCQDNIIAVLQEIDLHQSLKTDEQRIAKMLSEETESYWQFLHLKENKTLLDNETLERCKESVSIIRNSPGINQLLDGPGMTVENELFIKIKNDTYKFGLHGQVDNICFEHTKKIVYINDLKTSSKTLDEFQESLTYYRYWLQAAIYYYLVTKQYNLDPSWKVIFTFIVIDKYQQVYPFEVSSESMTKWLAELSNIIKQVNFHYITKNYSLPYKFIDTKIML